MLYKPFCFYCSSNCKDVDNIHANPLARSTGQVKLDSDKWKLWKNLFEYDSNFSKFGFWASRWKKLR